MICVGKERFEYRTRLIGLKFLSPHFAIVCIYTSSKYNFIPNTHSLCVRILVVCRCGKCYSVVDLLVEQFDGLVGVIRRAQFDIIISELGRGDVIVTSVEALDAVSCGDVCVTDKLLG